jgi:MFS transporter, FHS family, L-fucose permease
VTGKNTPVISKKLLIPFALITFCFALWGFANDITNPLVKAFGTIFNQSTFISSFVQFSFYAGYCFMAIPAALYIKRYSYKSGILVGLALYAIGGIMFIPASLMGIFWPFLAAFFIMTCGLSFLETSANPYILAMGDPSTSTQRLNFAQSFNPIGSLVGIFIAREYILSKMNSMGTGERAELSQGEFDIIKMADLAVVRGPYVAIGIILIIVFILILITKMPKYQSGGNLDIKGTFRRLVANIRYREGVIAQTFYVGAQIAIWTYTIHYGTEVLMNEGMAEGQAAAQSVGFNFIATSIFTVSRFICTFLLKYVSPGALLMYLAIVAMILLVPVMVVGGRIGLYALIGVSGSMSLMFPTIYGIALKGVGEDAKLGAAGLVMAIAGGSILPPIQGLLIDQWALHYSFILPLLCFGMVAIYGLRVQKVYDNKV